MGYLGFDYLSFQSKRLTYEQILADLKQRKFRPVYFLCGKESFFIDTLSDFIETNALSEGERSFNQMILYGRDVDHKTVIDNARRYPMMSEFQVVILKEAQEMKDLKELAKYVSAPTPSTVLVICHKHKAFNKNTKFGKLLKEKAVFFEGKKLYDNQVPEWIQNHLKSLKLKISPQTSALLAEYLGTDLSLVARELEKLSLHLDSGTEVTSAHVEEHVGISREYNIFELQKALAQRNLNKVTRIVKNFMSNPKKNPLIMVIASLSSFFTKVYLYQFVKNKSDQEAQKALNLRSSWALKDYRAAVRNFDLDKTENVLTTLLEYDLKAKGVNYNSVGKEDGELMKEMIWKILR